MAPKQLIYNMAAFEMFDSELNMTQFPADEHVCGVCIICTLLSAVYTAVQWHCCSGNE